MLVLPMAVASLFEDIGTSNLKIVSELISKWTEAESGGKVWSHVGPLANWLRDLLGQRADVSTSAETKEQIEPDGADEKSKTEANNAK